MDSGSPAVGRSHRAAISQRPDGWRMGVDRADDPAGQARRAAARGERPRSAERHLLCAVDRLPVAGSAQGFAAEEHGASLLWSVGLDGTLERIHHALYVETRERAGREASPTAAIIDSQSGKAAQKGVLRSTRKALMRARKSPAASATSWLIRWASC